MKKYKKYLLSAFVLFVAYAVMSPHTTSAFWPFDWFFSQNNNQKSQNYAGAVAAAPAAQGVSPDQLVRLLISLGVISPEKADQAMKTLTGLSKSYITVLSPNGGEKWTIGSLQTITWSSLPTLLPTDVSISLVDQGNLHYYTIADRQPNNGVFSGIISNDIIGDAIKAGSYKVRIDLYSRDPSGARSYISSDESDAPFNLSWIPTSGPHAEWSLISANAFGVPGVIGVASSSVVGTITLKAKAVGGTMKKPIAGDFTVVFASSTKKNGDYNTANSITVTPTIQVSPMDDTVVDGGEYTVTLTGVIYSSNPLLGSSQPLFMAIKDIDSVVGGMSITNQTWGIDNFYTNPVMLTKS